MTSMLRLGLNSCFVRVGLLSVDFLSSKFLTMFVDLNFQRYIIFMHFFTVDVASS